MTITNEAELYAQKAKLYKMLENGDIDGLTDAFIKLLATTNEQLEKVRVEYNYFTQNRNRDQTSKKVINNFRQISKLRIIPLVSSLIPRPVYKQYRVLESALPFLS